MAVRSRTLRFLQRFRVSHRLWGISVFVAIAVGVLLTITLKAVNQQIATTNLEREGVRYLRPVGDLFALIPARHLAAVTETPGSPHLASLDSALGASMALLDQMQSAYGRTLRTPDADVETVRRVLAGGIDSLSQQLALEALERLNDTVGDNSTLVLDPDLDSYYLMAVVVGVMPRIYRQVTALTEEGLRAPRQPPAVMALQADRLEQVGPPVLRSTIARVIAADRGAYGTSPTLAPVMHSEGDALVWKLRNLRKLGLTASEGLTVTPGTWNFEGGAALEQSRRYFQAAATELDVLLRIRIGALTAQRNQSIGLGVAFSLAAFLLTSLVLASIHTQLAKLLRLLDGDVVEASRQIQQLQHDGSALGTSAGLIITFLQQRDALVEQKRRLEAAQAELIDARDRAEAGNLAKSRFLATMSHELRTPLNGTLGMTELLLESPLNHEQREWAQLVQQSGEDLLGLIEDILEFARLDAGTAGEPACEPLELRPLLARVVDAQRPAAARKGLDLALTTDEAVPARVQGDAARLERLLGHLLENAVRFTPAGSVSLTAAVLGGGDAGARLALRIQDTGPGLPASLATGTFEPFRQADSSSSREHGGAGLGLPLAHRLAHLLGGNLQYAPVNGGGSAFTVVLPLRAVEAGDDASPRMVVADNNPLMRLLLCRLLERMGHTVAPAADAAELDRVLAQGPADLVFLDLHLPGLAGADPVAWVGARTPLGAPPVVALRAGAGDATPLPPHAAGELVLPVTEAALGAALAGWRAAAVR